MSEPIDLRLLVEYIAKSLVESPEQVIVTEAEKDGILVLELRVAPDDMGKVIGRQGRIAKAMRSVLRAASIRDGRKCTLEII